MLNRGYHDFYVGYHIETATDRFYGGGGGGYYVYDITDLDDLNVLVTLTNIRGVNYGHTFTPTPDGRYVTFSYGPKFKKKNLKGLLPEFPGVEAPGWDTCVALAEGRNVWVKLTNDGSSNKEADWVATREGDQ